MNTKTAFSVLRNALAACTLIAGSAHAAIIIDYGVDSVTRQFVIDGGVSTVTHNPGLNFLGQTNPVTFAVTGNFEATFSRHWWTYYLDGDASGSQGTFEFSENWLTFGNSSVLGTITPDGFAFPSYFIRVDGQELAGDSGPCNLPSAPDTYCSGYSNGPLASLTGSYANGRISLQGSMPIVGGNLFEEFTYRISGNTIPEPNTLALILCGLMGSAFYRRKPK